MASILKEILANLPPDKISDACFEGANIMLYTKDKEYFLDNQGTIRNIVSMFKKRVELRPDPSITLDQDEARAIIEKVMPAEAEIDNIFFDASRSQVIIETEKPGIAIGKQGAVLREIREKTLWVPLVRRTPAIKSDIIEKIRHFLYEHSEARRKFLNKTGHRVYDGWIREKKDEWVRLSVLGAGRQVGRSCFLLQTPESRILLDCGIDPARMDQGSYPYLEAPEVKLDEIDAVILSHAHLDHCGMIPYLFKFGYDGPIYCTAPTRDVTVLQTLDFVKIMKNEGKDPLYTAEEVKKMVMNMICLDYEEVTDITPDIRITFYDAGHILGSAMTHIHIGNGLHNFLYTADIKYGRTHLLNPAATYFPRLETMLLEATYGGRDNVLPSELEADEITKDVIKRAIERHGKVLVPVLGCGRAQEMMLLIEKLVRTKEIPEIPVFVDGIVWDMTAIHTAYPEFLNSIVRKQIFHKDNNPFLSPIFKRVGSQKERVQIFEETGSCVILATSGMLVGGPSVQYFRNLAGSARNALIFTSYQAEGGLGRRIQNGEKEFMFRDGKDQEIIELKMEVSKLEISGHCDRRQLMNFVHKCDPRPKKIILNHGENTRILDLASSIHKQYPIETVAPRNLEVVRLK